MCRSLPEKDISLAILITGQSRKEGQSYVGAVSSNMRCQTAVGQVLIKMSAGRCLCSKPLTPQRSAGHRGMQPWERRVLLAVAHMLLQVEALRYATPRGRTECQQLI